MGDRILIVDDEKRVYSIIAQSLAKKGIPVS
jgi:DNA-binding response OmpR family regulator